MYRGLSSRRGLLLFCGPLLAGAYQVRSRSVLKPNQREILIMAQLLEVMNPYTNEQAGTLPLADGAQIQTLISEKAAKNVKSQIDETLRQGATLAYGGELKAAVVTPPVLTGVTKNMDVAVDMEIFGPAFPLIPFKNDDEAVEIANATRYGLHAGVITRNTSRAVSLAGRIKAGSVVLNGHGNYRHLESPFGGYKMTGIGREGISHTLEEFSQLKTLVLKNSVTR